MQQFQGGVPIAVPPNPSLVNNRPSGVPMTASIRRPNSAARRLGTGADPAQAGNPVNVPVQVDFRPITQHGMTGMRTPSQGPGRQFADTTFFAAELRNKITEVADEVALLDQELGIRNREQTTTSHLLRKYEEMRAAIQSLEGQLADYNLAHDKIRTGTDIRELTDRVNRMQIANDHQKQKVDELFTNRADLDSQRAKLGEEIELIVANEEASMAGVQDNLHHDYHRLREEWKETQNDLHEKEGLVSALHETAREQSALIAQDDYQIHIRGKQLQRQKQELISECHELREECDANRTIEQLRERLQIKVKEDAIIVKAMEEKRAAFEQESHQIQNAIHEREQQKENAKEFEDVAKKYEALYQRDKAMQEFIDKFEAIRGKDAEQKAAIQTRIVKLMEHISDAIIKKENLPSAGQVLAMESDLSFKSKELGASAATLDRVKRELDKRKGELEQISGLGETIRNELVNLRNRSEAMQNEIVVLEDVDGMKTREIRTKLNLEGELAMVKHKRAAIQLQVQNLSKAYEAKKQALRDDEDWKRMESLEGKLRTYSQTVHSLQSHLAGRKRESDFEPIRKQIVQLTTQLNALLIRHQQ